MTPELALQVAALVATVAGAMVGGYVAIRADLAALRAKVETVILRAESAHSRLDVVFQRGGVK